MTSKFLKSFCIAFSFFFIVIFCFNAAAQESQQLSLSENSALLSNTGQDPLMLSLYKKFISPVDGDRCPSYPSCSSYSAAAIKKHGFFIGWMMTVDRLIHEGKEETEVSTIVHSAGRWKIFDPIENNDFWWYPENPNEEDEK